MYALKIRALTDDWLAGDLLVTHCLFTHMYVLKVCALPLVTDD